MTQRFSQVNQYLLDNHFYALLLSNGLAIGLFAGRVWLSQSRTLSFLVWNLFLAWVPYFWSLWALSIHRRFPHRWWALLLPGALWLAFFPNAPYILTDFLHLGSMGDIVPGWYDVLMLYWFAWTGLILGIVSLYLMQEIVTRFSALIYFSAGFEKLPSSILVLCSTESIVKVKDCAGLLAFIL